MKKIFEKMLDHPIRSSILIGSILGGIAKIVSEVKDLKK